MANFGNPMDYFQAGRAGGAARSPVSGLGNAIRGVLDQGKKMGLINAQIGGNLSTGLATAGYKQRLEENYNKTPQTYLIVDSRTGTVRPIDSTVGNKPIVDSPPFNMWNVMDPNMVPGGAASGAGQPKQPGLSDEEAYKLWLSQQPQG